MEQNTSGVALIAFYNTKALGVRYLETGLADAGYSVYTIFYKGFNSVHPKATTEVELELLCERIEQEKPMLIGLSVMSSMYLDTVNLVIEALQKRFDIPIVCGGAFASMFPEYFLVRGVQFVIRTDGERSLTQLAEALTQGGDYRDIPSLCYRENGADVLNPVGNISRQIDEYGLPAITCAHACLIENNTLREGDPQTETLSYEVIASRGCPFTCSYCCCINLKRLFPAGEKYVRTRSVQSVIDELLEAKKACPKLVFIHFYDEIFPNTPGWVDEFIDAYRKQINLPFTIWSHPKMVDAELLKKLVSVGLVEVIMGIQSGSPHIRREVFHRYETQEDIINATRVIKEAGVFWASYDFMLQHPFETIETMKETYEIVRQMYGPFELQLHGLNFLPGTDIVEMAIEQGLLTREQLNDIMFAPMEKQFGAYWELEKDPESQLWYKLTYCLQFALLRPKAEKYAVDPLRYQQQIESIFRRGEKLFRMRYLYKKARIVQKSKLKK